MKSKINTEDFCSEFYNQWVFPDIAGSDPWETYCEVSYKKIAEADPVFKQVDFSGYVYELRALRLEVFGVAWWNCFKNKERILLGQSEFTKFFLKERGDDDIWESMENYNQAIARATMGGHKPNSGAERAHITFMNSMRTSLFDKWLTLGYDGMIVARVANRFGSTKAWKSERGHVYLSFELESKLGLEELNEKARSAIIYIIQGFYNGSVEAIKEVKIVKT